MTGLPDADLDAAVDFLHRVRPEGPWTLTCIIPDGPTDTATFDAASANAAREWLAERSGRMNLYWMVNPAMRPLSKKAKKEDVKELAVLHVDIDPAKGEDPEAARSAALARLDRYDPAPSVVIDSGGGVQAFWILDEPRHIGGDASAVEEAELYNRQLIADLGGDGSCFNVDRIMRLPGTINLPGEKKRKAGRKPRLATLDVGRSTWQRYPLAEFAAAPAATAKQTAKTSQSRPDVAPPRLADLDELPETVTPRTRMLIVQGDDPDDQTRYGSRSEVVFAVCCEMVRAGCDDDTIAAVLLDPDFAISGHVLAQRRSVEYAARQIERAREEVAEPMLARMNTDHAVVELYGGKCRIISWGPSEMDPNRTEIVAQSVDDFRNRYMNIKVQVGQTKEGNPVYSSAGKWWLEHPMRRTYLNVVFRPDGEVGERDWNIWQGLAVKAVPGEWPLLRRLIVDGLAGGDEALADYVVRWSAFAVQNPGKPAEVALALIGGKGTGKSTFARVMCRIFGQHGVAVAGPNSLTSNFNKHLHGCALLFADEAVPPGNKGAAGLVKGFITEPSIMVEPKGVDAFPAPNRLKVIIASNNSWVVDASDDERRYAVLNVSSRFAAPQGAGMDDERMRFWRDLRAEIEGGGIEAFLHHLLALDLGNWHPRYDVPQTSALNEQRAASLEGFEQVWFEVLQSGDLPALSGLRKIGGDRFVLPSRQLAEYSAKISRRSVSANWIGNVLGAGQPDKDGVIHRRGMGFEKWERGGPKGWVIPPLPEAREAWSKSRGWTWQWDDSTVWCFDTAVIDQGAADDSAAGDEPY